MSLRTAGLLALLLAPSLAAAQEAVADAGVVDARGDKEVVDEYRSTVARFSDRMGEFEDDAAAWVRFREGEERASLEENYGAVIEDLDEDDRALRATAARRFEAFLDKYPNASHSAHVMFRLAELYFEDAEEDYLVADAEFRRVMDATSDADFENLPEQAQKDYRRSARLYRRILEQHPEYEYIDGCYYMLGYVLSHPASALYDEEKGLGAFQDLVSAFPESQFAAYAHLRIGEYYFDYNNLEAAIPHYRRVVELEGDQGRLFDKGLYKLAWSEYKRSNYDAALGLLSQLLDWSERYEARTGRESAMTPEAIEYTAISFSDVADIKGQHPLEVARTFYSGLGGRDYELEVYKRLGDVLSQQARYDYAIDVYNHIQQAWPTDPDNPKFLWTVATLHASKSPRDEQGVRDAIGSLNDRYGEDSVWWSANRNNPDAQGVARSYIEQSLAGVATTYHQTANDSGEPEDFLRASEYYRQYLTKFPFADDYYEIQWYLAEMLLRGGRPVEASKEYTQLLKGGDHNYREASLWYLRAIAYFDVKSQFGQVQTLPPTAEVEKKVEIATGGERPVYKLGAAHLQLLEASDDVLAADFNAAIGKVEDALANTTDKDLVESLKYDLTEVLIPIAEGVEKSRVAITYQSAQVLYAHGRYDEARPRLQAIIERNECTEEAAYSARLIVDSYTNEQDWANVRQYAALYASKPLGENCGGSVGLAELGTLEQKAALKEVELLVQADQREAAAEAYLQFISDYPKADPEILKNALYNAANNFERVGRLDDSIRLFKQFVAEYPNDELSRPLYFRLADNYARALELDQAVRYYEALYDVTNGAGKPYGDAPAALFNAGFLRIGMSDYEGAARTFERYERENSGEPDAEPVLFMAREQWARVGAERERAFLKDYLRRYPDQNPDHVIEAHYRLAKLASESGRGRETDAAWASLAEAYDRLAPTGRVGPVGRKYAAQAELRDLLAQLDGFREVPEKLKGNAAKYTELMVQRKEELPSIERRAGALVAKYKDFESSSAALYSLGTAYLVYADQLYNAPVPPEIASDPDYETAYFEVLDELRLPLEDKGKTRLNAVIETATAERAWSEWQTAAVDELARRFPAEFAPEKQELRGVVRDRTVPTAGAVSVEAAPAESTPTPEAPAAPEAP